MKKAQVAMEYIITYGWALLAVMVLVAGLSFFGIFEPEDTLAEKCYISSDILCDDYEIVVDGATETMKIYIKNTHREDYYVSKVQCEMGSEYVFEEADFTSATFESPDGSDSRSNGKGLLKTNRYVTITCGGIASGDLAPKGSKIKAKILLDMETDTTFIHQIEGEVIAKVK